MLQNIRDNTQGVFVKILIGLIVVSFALFGLGSITNLGAPSGVAQVNGEPITSQLFAISLERQRGNILNRMGENADPSLIDEGLLKGQVREQLISESVLIQAAKDMGLAFSDRFIDTQILENQSFHDDNGFNQSQYETLLRSNRYTPTSFKQTMRSQMLSAQVRNGISDSNFATDFEVTASTLLRDQTRDLALLYLDLNDYVVSGSASEDDVQSYYQLNEDDYRTEEKVQVEYLQLELADFFGDSSIEVTEAELQQAYAGEVEAFKGIEERSSAHILVAIDDATDEAAALVKIQALANKIDLGEDFASLAKKNSDDPGSARLGGDLGFVQRGSLAAEFDVALFDMVSGQVSAPVKTSFGYHLIKLQEIRNTQAPTFAELESRLRTESVETKAKALFFAAVKTLEEKSFESSDLAEPAEVLGLSVQQSEWFTRDGNASDLSQYKEVVKEAYSEQVLNEDYNSEVVRIGDDKAFVVRLAEYAEATVKPLAEVSQAIAEKLDQDNAQSKLDVAARDIVAQMVAGAATNEIAAQLNKSWSLHSQQKRYGGELSRSLIDFAFALTKPVSGEKSLGAHTLSREQRVIVAVTQVTSGDSIALNEAQRKQSTAIERLSKGRAEFDAFLKSATNQADIERYKL